MSELQSIKRLDFWIFTEKWLSAKREINDMLLYEFDSLNCWESLTGSIYFRKCSTSCHDKILIMYQKLLVNLFRRKMISATDSDLRVVIFS